VFLYGALTDHVDLTLDGSSLILAEGVIHGLVHPNTQGTMAQFNAFN
jgi:hypothetical protein